MKPITISPVSLVLGVLLAVGLFLVMGQAGPSSYGTWGPPRKAIVNAYTSQLFSVPGGGDVVVYQVPMDRWLTVTAAWTDHGVQANWPVKWCELSGGTYTAKGLAGSTFLSGNGFEEGSLPVTTPSSGGEAVGWVFKPGSQVVIRNTASTFVTVNGYSLLGYESRD